MFAFLPLLRKPLPIPSSLARTRALKSRLATTGFAQLLSKAWHDVPQQVTIHAYPLAQSAIVLQGSPQPTEVEHALPPSALWKQMHSLPSAPGCLAQSCASSQDGFVPGSLPQSIGTGVDVKVLVMVLVSTCVTETSLVMVE